MLAADELTSYLQDGKAEINGYTLSQTLNGEARLGKAVLIFETERDQPASEDREPLLELSTIRDIPTGMFDTHLLTSVYFRLAEPRQAAKISMSLQDWSGHLYQDLVIEKRRAVETRHTDKPGEGDFAKVHRSAPKDVVYEDALPILIRELQGPWLAKGESRTLPCAPSLQSLHVHKQPMEWKTITITKSAKRHSVGSVLGQIAVTVWTIVSPFQGSMTYYVEVDWPHRIIQWANDQGESGVLTGSKRLAYRRLNKNGDEKYLKELGWLAP